MAEGGRQPVIPPTPGEAGMKCWAGAAIMHNLPAAPSV